MEQAIMKIFNLLIAPILVIILPLMTALITLGLFLLANIIVQIIFNMKKNKIKWYRIDKWFDQTILDYILKTITSYSVTILAVSMFEVHIIGIQLIELGGQMISLTRLVVVIATAQQLGRMLNTIEQLTKYNLLDTIVEFLPSSIQKLFSKTLNKNGVMDIDNKITEDEKEL